MRYIVGQAAGAEGVFLVEEARAVHLPDAGSDLLGLASGGAGLTERRGATADLAQVTPMLPIARPGKIICLGLNYVDHIKEGGYDIPTYPALFMRGQNSIMAAGAPMILPIVSERLDYEVELMVIVGQGGRHIAEADALRHVFGYTVFNDGSVRDFQRKTHQWTPGKNFDATGPVGPIVVTPDELPEGAKGLKIESRVGAEILQSANTDDMLWPVARTIATISEYATLEPGDMIAMGTPPGVGHARTPPRWLRAGETVECEVEGICICASPVIAETDLTGKRAAE